jgi:2-polyprenyl-6-hydroxyphenyl methylase/3-demethylubiquinone-9 3-methyltransferase
VADELLRVCRPGGTIGMINFTPEGTAAEFFEILERYAPPSPPATLPPLLWGSEPYVRELFGDRVSSLELSRRPAVEKMAGSVRDYVDFYKETFGPVVAIFGLLAQEPERAEALDREFVELVTRVNRGAPEGPVECHYEYLLVVARKRDA